MAKLGSCMYRRKETVLPATLADESVNVVGLEDIEDGGRGGVSIRKAKPSAIASLKTLFQQGDILYGKLRPYLNKVALAPVGGICSTEIWALVAESYIDPYFAYLFLSSSFFVQRIASLTEGANLPRIDVETFNSIEIPLPPISEQHRIVEILREQRDIQSLCDQADERRTKLVASAFHSIFLQSKERTAWPEVTVGEIAARTENSIRTGPFGSDLLHSEFVSEGIPVLGIDNAVQNRFVWAERRFIASAKYASLKRFRVFPRDVMITIMGTVGRAAVAPPDLPECISTKHLCVITPDTSRILPYFLWAVLLFDPSVRAQSSAEGKGAIMEGLNSKIIRRLRFRLPPVDLQARFERIVDDALPIEDLYLSSRGATAELTRSLIANAFSGQLTAEWRESSTDVLQAEGEARDEALRASTSAISRTVRLPVASLPPPQFEEGAYAELTRDQRRILQVVRNRNGELGSSPCFTAEELARDVDGPSGGNAHAIELSLGVLAVRGLVIALSREQPATMTGEIVYGNAYRLPLEDFPLTTGDPREPIQGEKARSRELGRLAALLRGEPAS